MLESIKKDSLGEVPNRIVEVATNSPDEKAFELSAIISAQTRFQNFYAPMYDDRTPFHNGIGDIGGDIVWDTVNLPGVKSVAIYPYKFEICKSAAVDWEMIVPRILGSLIKHAFDNDTVDVQLIKAASEDSSIIAEE